MKLLILSIVFIFPYVCRGEAPQFDEAFIGLKITKERGDGFYRVFTDQDENPYLQVDDILAKFLDFSDVECDQARKYCQGTLQPDNKVFWIDFNEKIFGSQESGKKGSISSLDFTFQDNKFWLRHNVWPKWLNVSSNWSVKYYSLHLLPFFNLIYQTKQDREDEIRRNIAREEEREKFETKEVMEPEDPYGIHGRYRIRLDKFSNGDLFAELDYDLKADVVDGTFSLGGTVTVENESVDHPPQFWQYKQLDTEHYHLLEVGYTNFDETSALLPTVFSDLGIQVKKRKTETAPGLVKFNRRTQPKTLVDVYLNGAYLATTVSDDQGYYVFENISAAGGDIFTFKHYFTNGAIESQDVKIASDIGNLVPESDFDAKIFIGDTEDGVFAYSTIRYGVMNGLSLGIHPMKLPSTDNVSSLFDVTYRPIYGINLHGEVLVSDHGFDLGLLSDVSMIPANYIQFEYRNIGEDSPLLFDPEFRIGDSYTIRHTFKYSKFQIRDQFQITDNQNSAEATFQYSHNTNFYTSLTGQTTKVPGFSYVNTYKLDLNYLIRPFHEFRLSRNWLEPQNETRFNYKFQGGDDIPFDANIAFALTDDGDFKYIGSGSYRITDRLIFSILANDEYFGIQLAWDDIISKKPGPSSPDDFGSGTITGRVMSPNIPGEDPMPLENITILAGAKKAVTDENGEYIITGISTGQRVKVSVNQTSLDASMAPKEDYLVYRLRPTTVMEYNPELVPTIGMDGVLDTDGEIPSVALIEAIRIDDDRKVTETKPESDGFFVLEGLTPGEYKLVLKNVSSPPEPLMVSLSSEEDWVSGKRWLWKQNNSEGGADKSDGKLSH